MYELIRVSEHDYYVDCPSKIGLVAVGDGNAVCIDSGNDKDTGKKVLKAADAAGLRVTAVYNTHAHADHIGGNKLIGDRTGCRLYARGIECDYACHPLHNPSTLWGGRPYGDLRNRFLLAQESRTEPLTDDVLPAGMTALDLPGHSPDMTGFRTPDGTVYLGDCLVSRETLDKYGICFLWDVQAYLDSLDKVMGMEAACFVPSHAPATADIRPLAAYNRDAVAVAAERLLSFCASPVSFDQLLADVFSAWELTMNAQQHALIGSTVRSYLAWLYDKGEIGYFFENNIMKWVRK